MLSIRNLSIKNKMIWMQVITSILVLGLCFIAFVVTDIRGYKDRKISSTISIAQVIGVNSVSAIQFLDNEAAERILANLQQVEPDVVTASIFDKKGYLFADYTKKGNPVYNFSPPFTDQDRFDNGFLYVYKNIFKNNEFFGTVCLQVRLAELDRIKTQKLQIAILLLIIGITLAFIIAIINQRYISNPLLTLIKIIDSIRESGDFDRHVPVTGKDEITKLSLEFNNLMDEIKLSHEKKDEFIGIASHELKTPLTIIKGFLEMLDDAELDDQNKFFVDRAMNSTNKLQSLVFDLLDVSRIQSGQLQLNMQEFDLNVLIDECINNAQINAEKHPILKKYEHTSEIVCADRNRLEQVIINLLSNAIKYSGEGESILVQTKSDGSTVMVSVQDFGIGLSDSEHERIFDRFYRSSKTNIGTAGFGLGLYICAQIIKQHNGKIWVDSLEGKGSTFYFELPVKP
jgi:signal transduction histidine kinase